MYDEADELCARRDAVLDYVASYRDESVRDTNVRAFALSAWELDVGDLIMEARDDRASGAQCHYPSAVCDASYSRCPRLASHRARRYVAPVAGLSRMAP
jgi:hypothetical protein